MGFNVKKFTDAKFTSRIENIKVDALKAFFSDKEEPIFKVRNLSGEELGRVNLAIQKNRKVGAMLDGLLSNIAKEQIEALKQSIGASDNTPDDIVRRITMLEFGCVEPKLDQSACVKFCSTYPIEFYELTNTIIKLTGLGSELGKPKPSGKTQK